MASDFRASFYDYVDTFFPQQKDEIKAALDVFSDIALMDLRDASNEFYDNNRQELAGQIDAFPGHIMVYVCTDLLPRPYHRETGKEWPWRT